jgi:hypothetical protein
VTRLACALIIAIAAAALSVALALRLRRDARAWAAWADDFDIVGMPTWPYRGEVS